MEQEEHDLFKYKEHQKVLFKLKGTIHRKYETSAGKWEQELLTATMHLYKALP